MLVQNLKGTSNNICKCKGGWYEHWEKFSSGSRPRFCSVIPCSKFADLGGHVIKYRSVDREHYIIPLCREHNNAEEGTIFEIDDFTPMAKANVAETCGNRRG